MSLPTITQIAVSSGEDMDLLYILRSDGSVWVARTNWNGIQGEWVPIDPPSQLQMPRPPTRIPD